MRTIYVNPGTKVVMAENPKPLTNRMKSKPSELETLRSENLMLKKKLEEIKSIISS